MKTLLVVGRDTLKSQLWLIPSIAVLVAVLLGLALPEIDSTVDADLSGSLTGLIFGGDADTARSLLSAIASSLITVTALTFSITVVTLQLASSQFSPRLLRTFAHDQFVQLTLALFLSTFTYSLVVLRAVRSAGADGQHAVVPKLAVTFAFVLAVASVLALVLFLAHLTEQIRVETMLHNVHRDASQTVRAVLEKRDPALVIDDDLYELQPVVGGVHLLAANDGFLTWISHGELVEIAVGTEAIIRLDVHPGTFVVKGTPIGIAWPTSDQPFDQNAADKIIERVAECIHTGYERTAAQDVGYGLRQLTDVANKGLSPAINDPTTAIHALGHISALLCELTDHQLGTQLLHDDDKRIRVILRQPDLADYVDLGISQPRRYGASDPQVLERILQVLLDLSHHVHTDQKIVVLDQLERVRITVDAQAFDSVERSALALLAQHVEQNITGHRV